MACAGGIEIRCDRVARRRVAEQFEQHRLQAAGLQIVADDERRQHCDTHSGANDLGEHVIVVEPQTYIERVARGAERLVAVLGADLAESVDLARYLEAASPRDILVRLLHNLKRIYCDRDDLTQAVAILDLLLTVNPDAAEELRDRGLIYRRLECCRAALADLSRYLELAPEADDAESVRSLVCDLVRHNARLN